METIPIHFNLSEFSPDQRQYKTASPVLTPLGGLEIIVDVPLERELLYNAKEIILAETSGSKSPAPQLTIKGLAYIEDRFLERINKPEEPTASENKQYSDDDFVPFQEGDE